MILVHKISVYPAIIKFTLDTRCLQKHKRIRDEIYIIVIEESIIHDDGKNRIRLG